MQSEQITKLCTAVEYEEQRLARAQQDLEAAHEETEQATERFHRDGSDTAYAAIESAARQTQRVTLLIAGATSRVALARKALEDAQRGEDLALLRVLEGVANEDHWATQAGPALAAVRDLRLQIDQHLEYLEKITSEANTAHLAGAGLASKHGVYSYPRVVSSELARAVVRIAVAGDATATDVAGYLTPLEKPDWKDPTTPLYEHATALLGAAVISDVAQVETSTEPAGTERHNPPMTIKDTAQ